MTTYVQRYCLLLSVCFVYQVPLQVQLSLPLKSRTITSTQVGASLTSSEKRPPPVYENYGKENIERAYEAIKLGSSVRRAALQYSVPKSTLSDRVTGKVKFGSHSGPPRYLTDAEEQELTSFIVRCASIGCAKTKKEFISIVELILASKGKQVIISNGWWESFKKRHPELTLRTAEKLSYSRLVVTDQNIMNNYFDLLERTLIDNGFLL